MPLGANVVSLRGGQLEKATASDDLFEVRSEGPLPFVLEYGDGVEAPVDQLVLRPGNSTSALFLQEHYAELAERMAKLLPGEEEPRLAATEETLVRLAIATALELRQLTARTSFVVQPSFRAIASFGPPRRL
jgi:hypothetical protein